MTAPKFAPLIWSLLILGHFGGQVAAAQDGKVELDESLYRSGQPEVLVPDTAARDSYERETIDRFARIYGRRGSPRIAVFWNRRVSDRLTEWAALTRGVATFELGAKARDSQGDRKAELNLDTRTSAELQYYVPEQERRGLQELAEFEFQSGFLDPMLAAGAKVVDRAVIMRIAHGQRERQGGNEAQPDAQVVEMAALAGFADYFAEILMTQETETAIGWAMRVTVKNVQNGQIVASFVSRGEPETPAGPAKWEAVEGGFIRRAPDPNQVGRTVALETMLALNRAWR